MKQCTVFVFLILKFVVGEENVVVKIKQGVLAGTIEKSFLKERNYFAFKGVPYAEPPVGKLRFLPPSPHKGWENTNEAFQNKPTCLQFNTRMRNGEKFGLSGSEDCLYINIFTPSLEGSAPVMVFDYNDNFKTGYNFTDTYSPDFFVEEEVIVVTISHRLNMFGYLTTEDDVIPANNGLRDYILGLEWVQENIKKFGGDPTRVTLMGNRGGAVLADILLYTEKAKGLFSAVILQSGTAIESIYFYDNPRDKAFQFGELLNSTASDSTTLLIKLQQIDSTKLLETEFRVGIDEVAHYQRNFHLFAPTVEKNQKNAIVNNLPENSKVVNDVPVLIGSNSREGLDVLCVFIFEPRILDDIMDIPNFHFPIRTGYRFERESKAFKQAVKEINEFYLKDGYLNYDNILEDAVRAGDENKMYAVNVAAKNLASNLKSNVYYYMFDFRGSLNENSEFMMKYSRFPLGNWGATATDELCYLHLCSRIKKNYKILMELISEQAEIKVLKKMVKMWTNFAKNRNPTPEKDKLLKDLIWLPVDKDDPELNFLHITKNLKMKKNPMGKRAEFWDNFLQKYSSMAVDGVVGVDDIDNDKRKDEL